MGPARRGCGAGSGKGCPGAGRSAAAERGLSPGRPRRRRPLVPALPATLPGPQPLAHSLTPEAGDGGPRSFDSPAFVRKRVARGHHGLPVSSKTPPLPRRRPPLRAHRGRLPIALASAAPGPTRVGWAPRIRKEWQSWRRRGRGAAAGSRPVTQQHARGAQDRRRRPPRSHSGRSARQGNAADRGWRRAMPGRKGAAAVRALGAGATPANRKWAGGAGAWTGGKRRRWAWRTTCPVSLRGRPGRAAATRGAAAG